MRISFIAAAFALGVGVPTAAADDVTYDQALKCFVVVDGQVGPMQAMAPDKAPAYEKAAAWYAGKLDTLKPGWRDSAKADMDAIEDAYNHDPDRKGPQKMLADVKACIAAVP